MPLPQPTPAAGGKCQIAIIGPGHIQRLQPPPHLVPFRRRRVRIGIDLMLEAIDTHAIGQKQQRADQVHAAEPAGRAFQAGAIGIGQQAALERGFQIGGLGAQEIGVFTGGDCGGVEGILRETELNQRNPRIVFAPRSIPFRERCWAVAVVQLPVQGGISRGQAGLVRRRGPDRGERGHGTNAVIRRTRS